MPISIVHKKISLVFLSVLVPLAVGLYIIESIDYIHHGGGKYYFDMARLVALSLSIVAGFISIKIERHMILLLFFIALILFSNPTVFMSQILASLLLGYIICKKEYDVVITYSVRTSLALIFVVFLLSNIGLIDSGVIYNDAADISNLLVEKKESFGFWHPNVSGSIVAGCLAAAYYFRLRIEYLFSMLMVLYLALSGASRTYIIVSFLIIICELGGRSSFVRRYVSIFAWIGVIMSVFVALMFMLPDASRILLGDRTYYYLDMILSYRLSIAHQSVMLGVEDDGLIDSFYLNVLNNYGFVVVFASLLSLMVVSYRALRLGMREELVLLFMVSLCANFENTLEPRGILGLVFFVSIFYVINRGRKQINTLSRV